MPKQAQQPKQISKKSLIWMSIAIVALWAISGFSLFFYNDRGTFGDMFGAINALFSGLAFAALVYTIILQQHEINQQRESLAKTNETINIQTFETTFFHLMGSLNQIIESLKTNDQNGSPINGRDCFTTYYRRIVEYYNTLKSQNIALPEIELVALTYYKFHEKYQWQVGHYFRMLYNIVKFVDKSDISNKQFYTNILRAQLSSQETLVLFYNCLSQYGVEKFKPLVESYSLLKTVPQNKLISADYHPDFYSSSAYQKQS